MVRKNDQADPADDRDNRGLKYHKREPSSTSTAVRCSLRNKIASRFDIRLSFENKTRKKKVSEHEDG